MTPREFWEAAAQWGSYVTAGDPGGCMYGFNENGFVQSEAHRKACLSWLETHCRPMVLNAAYVEEIDDLYEREVKRKGELQEINDLIEYLKSAPVMPKRRVKNPTSRK